MTSFLFILFVAFADIVGAVMGLGVLIQGLMFLSGMYCHHCIGDIPWWTGLTQVAIGIIFCCPNSLFRYLVKRLSIQAQHIGFLLRAVIVTAFMIVMVALSGGGVEPFWVWFVMLARPISAFALALEAQKEEKQMDSEQIVSGDQVNLPPER